MSIFKQSECKVEKVVVEGTAYYVRQISALEKDHFDIYFEAYNGDSVFGYRGFLTAMCLSHEDGTPRFDPGEGKQASKEFINAAEEIMHAPARLVEPIFEKVTALNRLDEDDAKKNATPASTDGNGAAQEKKEKRAANG